MKRSESSPNRPLTGIRVLVGRARHQAGALSRELRKQGAIVLEIPFIEIRKPRSFRPLDTALKNLHTYDWLILTSVNGVEAMWERMSRLRLISSANHLPSAEDERRIKGTVLKGRGFSRAGKASTRVEASAAGDNLRIAAIGPATKKAIEQCGLKVDIVPNEYVAESVVHSLRAKVEGKRVLLVRAKVARDVIPRELRRAGAHVDVVEAYETVVPQNSRRRLQSALANPRNRPHVVTFTSSSTVRNFVSLLDPQPRTAKNRREPATRRGVNLDGVLLASIGPVTSATLCELGLRPDIQAKEFTIPGLVEAIVRAFGGWGTNRPMLFGRH